MAASGYSQRYPTQVLLSASPNWGCADHHLLYVTHRLWMNITSLKILTIPLSGEVVQGPDFELTSNLIMYLNPLCNALLPKPLGCYVEQ